MAVNTETISRRVHGRATAAAAIEVSGLDTMPLESFTAFWEHMRDLANAALPKPETPAERQPMTDEQASLFGPTPLPYGKYTDQPVNSVPLNYLTWLVDAKDEFKEQLRRYLESPLVKRWIEEESEWD